MYASQLQITQQDVPTYIKITMSRITTHELAYEYQGKKREGDISEPGQITALLVAFAN